MKLAKHLAGYAKDMKYYFYYFNIFSVAFQAEKNTICRIYSILQVNEKNVYVPYLYIESDSIELHREIIYVTFQFIFKYYDYNYHLLERYCDIAYIESDSFPSRTFSSHFKTNNNQSSNVILVESAESKVDAPLQHFAEIFTFGSEKKLLQFREHQVIEEDEYSVCRVISVDGTYYLERSWKRKDLFFVYYFIISQVQFYKTVCLFEGNKTVCNLFHYDSDAPNFSTVYSEFGTLENLKSLTETLSLTQMLQIVHRICMIVSQLHRMKFYHFSLSPKAFVIINERLDLKITRFEKVRNIYYYSTEEQYEFHSIDILSLISSSNSLIRLLIVLEIAQVLRRGSESNIYNL